MISAWAIVLCSAMTLSTLGMWLRARSLGRQRDSLAETLASLQKGRSRFYATLSHELRSPLTVSLGAIESALEGRLGNLNDQAREAFDRAHRNNLRMVRRVDQLLDLARLESDAMVCQPIQADLASFLRKLNDLFLAVGEVHGVTMATEGLDHPVPFRFDAELVEKMVINLLSNAVAFTPEGGHVTLSLDAARTAHITVADTGQGMDPAQVRDLFETGSGSVSGSVSGSGIGLQLVKKLAMAHGGDVVVRSALGEGSMFTISLSPVP